MDFFYNLNMQVMMITSIDKWVSNLITVYNTSLILTYDTVWKFPSLTR